MWMPNTDNHLRITMEILDINASWEDGVIHHAPSESQRLLQHIFYQQYFINWESSFNRKISLWQNEHKLRLFPQMFSVHVICQKVRVKLVKTHFSDKLLELIFVYRLNLCTEAGKLRLHKPRVAILWPLTLTPQSSVAVTVCSQFDSVGLDARADCSYISQWLNGSTWLYLDRDTTWPWLIHISMNFFPKLYRLWLQFLTTCFKCHYL